jgi:hypothetical protein
MDDMHGGDGISNQPSRMPASSPRQQMVEGRLDVTLSLHLSAYQPTCRYVMRLACLKPWSCNPSCCKGALGPNMPKRTGIPRRTNNCRARSVGFGSHEAAIGRPQGCLCFGRPHGGLISRPGGLQIIRPCWKCWRLEAIRPAESHKAISVTKHRLNRSRRPGPVQPQCRCC